VALYDGRFGRALIGTSLTAFRPNQESLKPIFLAAALRAKDFQVQLERNMGQTTRNQVPITAQRELFLPTPPISLQQTFSTRIQAAEALKATHRTALAELDTLFASLQHRAFSGAL
jgi:type I restriction enzyme S subunit